MIKNILSILNGIILLFEENNNLYWSDNFQALKIQCETIKNKEDIEEFVQATFRIYGGMGSFNDYVVYRNGELMIEENERLDKLRSELFQATLCLRKELERFGV